MNRIQIIGHAAGPARLNHSHAGGHPSLEVKITETIRIGDKHRAQTFTVHWSDERAEWLAETIKKGSELMVWGTVIGCGPIAMWAGEVVITATHVRLCISERGEAAPA